MVIVTVAGESAGDELVRGAADRGKAAQVELDAEDVDSARGLFRVVVRASARTEDFGGGSELLCVFPEAVDGFLRLLGAPGGGNHNEVRREGSGGEVLVNQALADAKANSAAALDVRTEQNITDGNLGVCLRAGCTYSRLSPGQTGCFRLGPGPRELKPSSWGSRGFSVLAREAAFGRDDWQWEISRSAIKEVGPGPGCSSVYPGCTVQRYFVHTYLCYQPRTLNVSGLALMQAEHSYWVCLYAALVCRSF